MAFAAPVWMAAHAAFVGCGDVSVHPSRLPTHSSPLPTHSSPLPTHPSPLPTQPPRLPTHLSPLPTQPPPLPTHSSSLPTQPPPLPTQPPPLPTHSSPLPTHLSPLPTHLSPLPTQPPPLTTHSSPLPTHSSPLPTHSSPLPRTLLDDLDDQRLFDSFHLTRPCVSFIVDLLRRQVERDVESGHTAEGMILLALHYYAKGTAAAHLREKNGIPASDVTGVIAKVSKHIADLAAQLIVFPRTRKDQECLAAVHQQSCGIPRLLGVLGTAHFRTRDGSDTVPSPLFLNTHGYTSVVSQVACDLAGNLLSVEQCQVGSTTNHKLWSSSVLKTQSFIELEYWLIVGRGYQQNRHLLPMLPRPYNHQQLSFNVAHSQVRAVLSRTLGHLKRRFRVLQLLGSVDERLDGKQRIIEACCVLHNLANQFSVPAALGPTARDLQHPARTAELPMEMLHVMPRFQLHHDLLQLVAEFYPPAGGHVATATESDEDDPPQTLASKWPPSK